MELCREPWHCLVAYAFVGAVVHVDEKRFPVGRQRRGIDGIAMILACDEATGGAHKLHRLVMTAMTILQLVCLCTCSPCQELVAETDAHEGPHIRIVEEGADVLHGLIALLRVARAIRQEQSIEVKLVEVIVPRNPDDFNASIHQATDDVCLYTTVNKNDSWK